MTTIPGLNQMLPQSSIAQELSNQGNSPKPAPDQAAVLQQAQEVVQGSTVQGAEESERLKQEKDKLEKDKQKKKALARRQEADRKKKKKINQDKEMALDPDATGRLLDTTV